MSELGPRLAAIAERVLPGLAAADLCCDHARLAVALVASGRVPKAIASDLNAEPLELTARRLESRGLGELVDLREGDGLSVLEPGEVGTVVLAGIGAPLAERLLSEGAAATGSLRGVRRLIVQANHNFPKLGSLRACLDQLGWSIVDECLARDQGRIYVIVVAEPGDRRLRDELDREIGPFLREGEDPLIQDWLDSEAERIARALTGMERGQVEGSLVADYQRYLAMIEELLRSSP